MAVTTDLKKMRGQAPLCDEQDRHTVATPIRPAGARVQTPGPGDVERVTRQTLAARRSPRKAK